MAQIGKRVFYGWYVAGGSFTALFLAYSVIYSCGTFFTPLSETFSSDRAGIAGLFAIAMSVPFILGTVTGPLVDRIGPRPLVVAGGVLIGVGLVIASRAQALWQVYAAYGLAVGLGAAAIRVPATEVVERWFVRRRGVASGVAVAGVGAGNLVGPLLAVALLRVVDWRAVYLMFGIAAMVGIVAAAPLLVRSPEVRGLRPDGDDPAATPVSQTQATGTTVRGALTTRPFCLLYAALLAGGFGSYVPLVHLVPDAESRGIHPVIAAALLSTLGAGSLAGRVILGAFADRVGRRAALILTFAVAALFLLWWLRASQVWSLAVFALGYGAAHGGLAALSPALASDYFGTRNAGAVIGMLQTALAPGALVGPTLAGLAFDLYGTHTVPILVSAGTMTIAMIFASLLPKTTTAVRPRPAVSTAS